MEHTPGPWWFEDFPSKENRYVVFDGMGRVAHVEGSGDESLADARLIAAAPELLVVAKRVIDMATCAMDYEGVDDAHTLKRAMERIGKAKRECERAVAKAERSGE